MGIIQTTQLKAPQIEGFKIVILLEVGLAAYGWINVFSLVGILLAITVGMMAHMLIKVGSDQNTIEVQQKFNLGYLAIMAFHLWLHQLSFRQPLANLAELPFGFSASFWAWTTSIFFFLLAVAAIQIPYLIEKSKAEKTEIEESINRAENAAKRKEDLELKRIEVELRKAELQAKAANQKAEAQISLSTNETANKRIEAAKRKAEIEAANESRRIENQRVIELEEQKRKTIFAETRKLAEIEAAKRKAEIQAKAETVFIQKAEKPKAETNRPSPSNDTLTKIQNAISTIKKSGDKPTQKLIARLSGVSERTIRNYKSQLQF